MFSRLFTIVISLALAAAAIAHHARDSRNRAPADQFVRRFHLEERRPEYAETIRYAPAADLTGEVAAEVAMQDALGSVRLSDVEPEKRQLWMESLADLDAELDAARALLLDALRKRPGWAYHRSLLGMIEYVRARREVQLGPSPDRWLQPLEMAMAAAPSDDSLATFTGEALLDAWPHLARVDGPRFKPIFHAALRDPDFISTDYLGLVDVFGRSEVEGLLPDSAPSLRAAFDAEVNVGDVEAAAAIHARWERAEWRSREMDLREITTRAANRDLDGLRSASLAWARKHSIYGWDTAKGRRQAAAVLAAWPNEPGEWRNDPRSDFIRFFLDRPHDADGRALLRAASALPDTPRPIFARAALLAGDVEAAQAAARSVEVRGTFEWTSYYVDLARADLAAGRTRDALAALETIAPAARNECDAILARAAVARAAGVQAEDFRAPADYAASLWSQTSLPICIDPAQRRTTLMVDLSIAGEPALVAYGFDGGRTATLLLQPGQVRVPVPLEGRVGRHIFSYRRITGGTVTPVAAALQ